MNWFKYRLPDSTESVSGASESLIQGLAEGFAVAPFLDPKDGLFTIPADFIPSTDALRPEESHIPDSTDPESYFLELYAIKWQLDRRRGKTVAARVISVDLKIDINSTFESLCTAYPQAFVFAFSTEKTGTWIGASPELLLSVESDKISTMALAGTRKATSTLSAPDWDAKNIDEQRMVTEFIVDRLIAYCEDVVCEDTFTKNAGPVEHICTQIMATMRNADTASISSLLTDLSPTPAVCGSNKDASLSIISGLEDFNRELYGGFCGPYTPDGKSSFYVILRAAKCGPDRIAVFAGGGITALSNPDAEWDETEMKSKTIINKLKSSEE